MPLKNEPEVCGGKPPAAGMTKKVNSCAIMRDSLKGVPFFVAGKVQLFPAKNKSH